MAAPQTDIGPGSVPGHPAPEKIPGRRSVLVASALSLWPGRLESELSRQGFAVTDSMVPLDRLPESVAEYEPDVVVIEAVRPTPEIMGAIQTLLGSRPVPVVFLLEETDDDSMAEAIRSGVAGYIVGSAGNPTRLRHALDVAMLRFEEQQTLARELAAARESLADRKIIDRAKFMVMDQHRLSEDVAYRSLRRLAMNHSRKLVDVARDVIEGRLEGPLPTL